MRRAAVAILAGLAAVSCGDEGSTPAEYRDEARRICRDAARATQAVQEPARATPEAIVDYFDRLLDANQRTTERFRELEPPEELEEAHADALDANREGVEEVRGIIEDIRGGGDPREVLDGAQERLEALAERSADAAQQLGVPECADR